MDNDGKLSGTDLIHGDSGVSYFKGPGATVAPSISVSTSMSTFDLGYAGSVPILVIDWNCLFFQLIKVRLRMTMSSMGLRSISEILRDTYTLVILRKHRVVLNMS